MHALLACFHQIILKKNPIFAPNNSQYRKGSNPDSIPYKQTREKLLQKNKLDTFNEMVLCEYIYEKQQAIKELQSQTRWC